MFYMNIYMLFTLQVITWINTFNPYNHDYQINCFPLHFSGGEIKT